MGVNIVLSWLIILLYYHTVWWHLEQLGSFTACNIYHFIFIITSRLLLKWFVFLAVYAKVAHLFLLHLTGLFSFTWIVEQNKHKQLHLLLHFELNDNTWTKTNLYLWTWLLKQNLFRDTLYTILYSIVGKKMGGKNTYWYKKTTWWNLIVIIFVWDDWSF